MTIARTCGPGCDCKECEFDRMARARGLTWNPGPPTGCICPPTSEQTCQSPVCPRRNSFGYRPLNPVCGIGG